MTPIAMSRKTIAATTDLPAPVTRTTADDDTAEGVRRRPKAGAAGATIGQGTRVAIPGPVTNPIAGQATNGVADPVKMAGASANDAGCGITAGKGGAVKNAEIAAVRAALRVMKVRAAIGIAAPARAVSGIAVIIAAARTLGHIVGLNAAAVRWWGAWAVPARERWDAGNPPMI